MNFGNNEIWRAINGYLNFEISSHGRVRNNKTGNILKGSLDKDGYCIVTICEIPKKSTKKIHRLVCEAFCNNINNYDIVDHIDQNKKNNFYENLRWVTQSINERNKPIFKNNKSGYKGVYLLNSGYWRVTWNEDEKKNRTKQFTNKDDAINYRKEIEQLHGYH